ncbi:cation diffusion facilitator CzcD-associated flavoprotein CzcO [Panacagrimonas perspica]|uniref:Cation diffusion facilitator CzcD-associated flavoprotein CzcO n=1 Tax=Panacagrimonas perspica TaxID=381431 RepID=A0A4S3K1F4_9GAMM|nr:NAD(P)/FAD-dependent oxidoreductase [Panacagrimonas perspica]TDU31071.1 cation diffusion facilitator CzcD-associated flavoprotein CzcO [Panacagrimonas perspica]THD01787.1 4-hydroxyacetophenone monooxygenase [Panacagrimonas perspica]
MAFDFAERSGGASGTDFHTLIVGTGFAGLGMAIKLKEEGQDDFVILERAADVGGTWRDNNYPGCACDVQSHLYSFSFEQNPDWSRMFAKQGEIWAYLRACSEKHGLAPHLRFGADVTSARWNDELQKWSVSTRDGRTFTGRVLISGMGGLSNPVIPDLKGKSKFKGAQFHSAQWRHDVDLSGKRVAVIGTGASAIQFVPQIQKLAGRVDLYQRTPPWIVPKPDRAISAIERRLFKRFPLLQNLYRKGIYWMLESRILGFTVDPRLMKLFEVVARSHIKRQVKDPVLRAKLTPDYTIGCKRILISDDYYPALTQANVEVIADGVREIRANSVVADDGTEREVDVIIWGTGFQTADPVPRGVFFGRNGIDILDAWKNGAEAYKGTSVAGFPNLFFIVGPNTGLGHSSMVFMIESQVGYISDALKTMRQRSVATVEVRPEALREYNDRLQSRIGKAVWNTGGCQSWYLDRNGRNVTLWPGATWQFRRQTRRFDIERYVSEPVKVHGAA